MLTAVRVRRRPGSTARSPGLAMVLAPVAVLPLGVAAARSSSLGDLVDLPPLATAYVVVLALALGTRAFHWDGLADTADGLTASYSPERSLEVMRTGPVGPAGVVAVVLVAGLQAAGAAAVVRHEHGWLGRRPAGVRVARPLALACVRGVPAARADGLGRPHRLGAGRRRARPLSGGRGVGARRPRPRLGGAAALGVVVMVAVVVAAAAAVRTPPRRDHRRRAGRGGGGLVRRAGAAAATT